MKIVNNTLKLDKEINDLDRFVFKFIKILEKYTDYVIVSGYVSILLGRSRSTEDIDIFIIPMDKIQFSGFFKDLQKNNLWCLNAEKVDEVYSYLTEGIAVRFAKKNQTIPNFEVKFAKKPIALESFNDRITVKTSLGKIKISSLERQIAFKRYFLKSDKDIEDAVHIETLFKGTLNKELIKRYKKMIEK